MFKNTSRSNNCLIAFLNHCHNSLNEELKTSPPAPKAPPFPNPNPSSSEIEFFLSF